MKMRDFPRAFQQYWAHWDWSGKCLLNMRSWHGLTGNRPPHRANAPQSEEVMSSNSGQLYNWAEGHQGDTEHDNEEADF